MTYSPAAYQLKPGGPLGFPKSAVYAYDFAVDGGATTAIPLRGTEIPSGAIIVDALMDVETALTGGTVTDTVQLNSEAAADLQAAAARNAAPWSTTGPKRLTVDADTAPVKTTAARTVNLKINGTAVTAGKFKLVVWYVQFA
jgi:hypothetical protein